MVTIYKKYNANASYMNAIRPVPEKEQTRIKIFLGPADIGLSITLSFFVS